MDLYEAIAKRHSVRTYADKPVEEAKLLRVLEAGRMAPSGCNKQAWRFVVVREAAVRQALAAAAEQAFLAEAPVVIAVVSLEDRLMSCQVPAGPVDCAIAITYMTLAATAEGLGTCWIGHFDQDKTRAVLGVPPEYKIIEMLTVGYAGIAGQPTSRKPLSEIVSYDRL